jgi:hypothetical protein
VFIAQIPVVDEDLLPSLDVGKGQLAAVQLIAQSRGRVANVLSGFWDRQQALAHVHASFVMGALRRIPVALIVSELQASLVPIAPCFHRDNHKQGNTRGPRWRNNLGKWELSRVHRVPRCRMGVANALRGFPDR